MNLPEVFTYSFMVRAFIAGALVSLVAPLIGSFLVARKFSLVSDTLGHLSLAGIAIGLLLHTNPLLTALVVSVIAAIAIDRIRQKQGLSGESVLAMFLSGGLALAIVLISLARGFNMDLLSYLFGSITTVSSNDLYLIVSMSALVIIFIIAFFKEFVYISFDEESARVSGIKVNFLNTLLMIMTALTVTISIRIVGSLLIGALMVIPVVTANRLARSFRQSILFSVLFSVFSVFFGLVLAYYLDLAAGGTIVLLSLLLFIISLII